MKQCKKCGELLTLANFREKTGGKQKKYISGICRACELAYEKERRLKNKLEIKPMEKVRFERKFKEIEPERILDVSKYGIQLLGTDEIFVKLMDYRDAYISNYGRCINICYNGRCNLLKGQKRDGKLSYTVRKTVFVDGISENRNYHLYAARAVVDNFIINPDQEHNTHILHSGYNQDDYYYKNLYPVNLKQFCVRGMV